MQRKWEWEETENKGRKRRKVTKRSEMREKTGGQHPGAASTTILLLLKSTFTGIYDNLQPAGWSSLCCAFNRQPKQWWPLAPLYPHTLFHLFMFTSLHPTICFVCVSAFYTHIVSLYSYSIMKKPEETVWNLITVFFSVGHEHMLNIKFYRFRTFWWILYIQPHQLKCFKSIKFST